MKGWLPAILIVLFALQILLFWPRAEASELPPIPSEETLTEEERKILEDYADLLEK